MKDSFPVPVTALDFAFLDAIELISKWSRQIPCIAVGDTLKSVVFGTPLTEPLEFVVSNSIHKDIEAIAQLRTLPEFEMDEDKLSFRIIESRMPGSPKVDAKVIVYLKDLKLTPFLQFPDVRAVGPESLDLYVFIPNPFQKWLDAEENLLPRISVKPLTITPKLVKQSVQL